MILYENQWSLEDTTLSVGGKKMELLRFGVVVVVNHGSDIWIGNAHVSVKN